MNLSPKKKKEKNWKNLCFLDKKVFSFFSFCVIWLLLNPEVKHGMEMQTAKENNTE